MVGNGICPNVNFITGGGPSVVDIGVLPYVSFNIHFGFISAFRLAHIVYHIFAGRFHCVLLRFTQLANNIFAVRSSNIGSWTNHIVGFWREANAIK